MGGRDRLFNFMSGEEAKSEQQSGARAGAAQGYTSDLSRDAALHVYETVFLHAAFGIAIIDSVKQLVQFANPAFARMHGFSGAEITGKPLLALVAPKEAGMWEEANRIISGTGHHVFEWTHQRKDGTQFPCSVDMTAVRDPQGLPLYWFASFKDITDRRRAEAALRETEATLESFYDSSPMFMGVAELEEDDIVLVYENKTSAAFVGSTRAELRGRLASEVGAPRGMIRLWIQHYRRSQTEGAPVRFEYEQPMAAGSRWVSATVSFIGMADSGRPRFSYVAEDITDRKQAEHALRESEQRYRSLFENSLDAIFSIDVNGRFRTANPAGIALSGYSLDELRERTFADLCAPEHLEKTMQAFLADLRGEQREIETEMIRRDGARVKVFVSGVPVRAGEKIVGVFGIARDITERKRAEEILRDAHRLLEERVRERTAELSEEKTKLDAILESTTDLIAALDLDFRFIAFNEAYRHQIHRRYGTGITLGMRLQDALNGAPAQLAKSQELWGRAFEGEKFAVESTVDAGEREAQRIYETRFSPIRNPQGKITGASLIARDITDREQVLEALRESEARWRSLSASAPIGIFLCDADGHCTYTNTRWQHLAGIPLDESLGEGWGRALHPEDRAGVSAEWLACAHEGREYTQEFRFVWPDGTVRWVRARATALRSPDGVLLGFVGTNEDITERKHFEDEIRRRNEELGAANRELEAFTYSVSHDLRAPLRGILGFSRALVQDYNDRLDDNARDSLRRIDAAAQRMSALISDLLQLSRLGRRTLRRHRVDLAAMAREIDGELRAAHPEREVRFTAPPQIWTTGDPGLLRSLLTNLIENAWKFTAHRPSAQIEFGCERNPSSAETRFFVRDNGTGFDMADAGLLFTPFQRLHAAEDFPGEGIGLATVQRIVARHGGRVWAEAAPDRGATFFFELPDSR